ncbi:MAG: hypothetical protein RMK20_01210, partial [Verrucomicrobiales bacterium]|nr:hypothetical protein [Verrucomicrobiales bacterium]
TQSGTQTRRTYNVGTNFGVGGRLTVKLVASDGTESLPFEANFDVIPVPPGIPAALLYVKPLVAGLTYATPEYSFNVLDSNPEQVAENIPVFGGKKLGFITLARASAEVGGDGSASALVSVGAGSKLPMAGFEVTPRIVGRPEWNYSPQSQRWVPFGSLGLEATASMSTPPAYVWATPPIYFRADVDVDTAILFRVTDWDTSGKPVLNGQWDFSAQVTGVAGCGASGFVAIEGYLGGGPLWTVQYPGPPILKKLGVQLNGGVRVVMLLFTWDAGLLHYEWWLVGGSAAETAYPRAVLAQLNQPDPRQWKLMPREYLSASTPYGMFLSSEVVGPMAWGDPVSPGVPLPLQTNIFRIQSRLRQSRARISCTVNHG